MRSGERAIEVHRFVARAAGQLVLMIESRRLRKSTLASCQRDLETAVQLLGEMLDEEKTSS